MLPVSGESADDDRQDLILGIVDNYGFYEISGFLITLKNSGYRGHVALFAGPKTSRSTIAKIRRLGVEAIPYRAGFPFIDAPHPHNLARLPNPIHIYNFRHFLYFDYLLKSGDRFRNVLISDVKDVVFQRDPFSFTMLPRLHVAMENLTIPIGDCAWTSQWLVAGYGPDALQRVEHREMSCAGTTLAPAVVMKRYLQLLLARIAEMKDAQACADQAAHNLLLHEGALEPTERVRNFEGPILTVGTEPSYLLNDRRELVNHDGSVIHIIHQYDRHKELLDLFERKVRPQPLKRASARLTFHLHEALRYAKGLGGAGLRKFGLREAPSRSVPDERR